MATDITDHRCATCGRDTDGALFDCPHCETPLSRSPLLKHSYRTGLAQRLGEGERRDVILQEMLHAGWPPHEAHQYLLQVEAEQAIAGDTYRSYSRQFRAMHFKHVIIGTIVIAAYAALNWLGFQHDGHLRFPLWPLAAAGAAEFTYGLYRLFRVAFHDE